MIKRVHFIGIGGSGMFPLSLLASEKGFAVSGSDRKLTEKKRMQLLHSGIEFTGIPSEGSLPEADMVVYSSAIRPEHPERKAALILSNKHEVQLFHRMDFLNFLVKEKDIRIGVAGTHGKTSTSSMLGFVLLKAGLEPDILVGGHPLYLEKGMRSGTGNTAVFETDESDGSFLKSNARFRICLNVDNDHLDYYKTEKHLHDAFRKFAAEGELTALNGDDPVLGTVSGPNCIYFYEGKRQKSMRSNFSTYHLLFRSQGEGASVLRISVDGREEICGDFRLVMPGKHFYLNALSIIALMDTMHLNLKMKEWPGAEKICDILSEFPGVERRMQKIAEIDGVEVYDDYGHHPTELRAVLSSLKEKVKNVHSLHAVFQPHRFTRTSEHYKEFAEVLSIADFVFLLPVYPSGEQPLKGVSSQLIADQSPESCHLIAEDQISDVFQGVKEGDVVVFLGAGDISHLAREYLNGIRSK